ncbi:phosphoribosylanthranilate isomerase [Pedobacter steynii]|uniref:N-(5'-phosphoribosyl)anthranilate isomerase n=1 Tax=Pedobacter steynii TaxID=430522 RepID=A0A1G9MRX1_9SPHI|nr:phosphoribosylanthranilate isomerase [Pedobacter steynii]NQX39515.1 phosphoribosylanthranilate isomerase [Pedobacter steynii]SDL76990.1 phosphoribosylanthranilate isomerase [Pedobacter steynii]
MKRPELKVCGMLHPKNILEVAALQPDYLGFIFFKGSKRYAGELDPEVVKALPEQIQRTGVFVNEDSELVLELIHKYGLNAVQLHGAESPEYCRGIAQSIKAIQPEFKLIKSFGVNADFDFEQLEAYQEVADYFLFDTQTPDHGGSGKKFDWSLLDKYTLDVPYFLSGGIGPESAEALNAIRDPRLSAIDINSRFELEPGLKDAGKLIEFKNKLS